MNTETTTHHTSAANYPPLIRQGAHLYCLVPNPNHGHNRPKEINLFMASVEAQNQLQNNHAPDAADKYAEYIHDRVTLFEDMREQRDIAIEDRKREGREKDARITALEQRIDQLESERTEFANDLRY
jgi:hypothetical protein